MMCGLKWYGEGTCVGSTGILFSCTLLLWIPRLLKLKRLDCVTGELPRQNRAKFSFLAKSEI